MGNVSDLLLVRWKPILVTIELYHCGIKTGIMSNSVLFEVGELNYVEFKQTTIKTKHSHTNTCKPQIYTDETTAYRDYISSL